jgi:DNA-binding response OmpR family regulator
LCVDDEPEVLEILGDYFTEQGFAVRTATNAQEALLEAKRWMPKALVVDLVMPRLGGLGTVEQIRRINPGIVVILISGRVDAADIVSEAGVGVAGAFTKPLNLPRVLASLIEAGVAPMKSLPEGTADASAAKVPKRVLVVDDEPDVREVLAEYLASKGFEVDRVSSGEEALEHVRESGPEIVLLDITMPGLSGVETLRGIRALSADTRVIMVSANTDVETARQTLALGATDYVPKPVDFGYLDSVLAMHALDHIRG